MKDPLVKWLRPLSVSASSKPGLRQGCSLQLLDHWFFEALPDTYTHWSEH